MGFRVRQCLKFAERHSKLALIRDVMLHDHAREVLFESGETDLFELLKITSHKSVCQLLMRVIHKRQHLRNGDRAYKTCYVYSHKISLAPFSTIV